jgi:hypothetical protein
MAVVRKPINYAPHLLMQMGGRIVLAGHPDEVWSCGIRGRLLAPQDNADSMDYLNEVAPNLLAWWKSPPNGMANTASLDYLKANLINAAGHYADAGNTNAHNFPANSMGGGLPTVPSFCTVAWSWTTLKARGTSSKGRIFLPNYTPDMGGNASPFITPAYQAASVQAAIGLLGVFRNTGGTVSVDTSIFSSIDASHQSIQGVRVGNVIDTQRRRKNAYTESYVSGDSPVDFP